MTAFTAPRLPVAEHNRVRRCAALAPILYPGPVGELVAKELAAVDGYGKAFGGDALISGLLDHLEAKQAMVAAAQETAQGSTATASETHR